MSFDLEQPAFVSLRDIVAERTRPLLAWVGAGASRAAGLPSWGGLRNQLVEVMRRTAESMDAAASQRLIAAADTASSTDDLWASLQIAASGLGAASFRDEVRRSVAPATTAPMPAVYDLLWALPLRGMLTLNLDGFAARALATADEGSMVQHHGQDIAKLRHIVTGPVRFVGNLHGALDDAETWIFTHDDLTGLLDNPAYQEFIRLCLSIHSVVFVGITADDLAVGGHLDHLARQGIQTPTHYWLTDRTDAETNSWAERVGVRAIRYSADDGHERPVAEFCQALLEATPREPPPAPPVALTRPLATDVIPPAAALRSMAPEEIRHILNARAAEILAPETAGAYTAYEEFLQEYRYPVYQAWYMSVADGENKVLDYELTRELASGAFGKVFEAKNAHGKQVAVKVLLEGIRENPEALHAFRRGVQSMRILSDRSVEGMVGYIEAAEIPAVVVMDLVEGPNLAEARAAGYIADWYTILRVAVQLTAVIRRAHSVPERVLHRDIRPQNVMLEGYYHGADWNVTVLDFDLSWHRDANQASVLHTTAAGYLAPEQMHRSRGVSTRSALVDSFGLGMTLLFLCSGEDPDPDQHLHRDWEVEVEAAARTVSAPAWRSVPARFARLILATTHDRQSARWDMAQAEGELRRLVLAAEDPGRVDGTELIVEELATQTPAFEGYHWDPDRLTAVRDSPTGLTYKLEADLQEDRVCLTIEFAATGVEERSGLRKYLAAGAKRASERLAAGGWHMVSAGSDRSSVRIEASRSGRSLADGDTAERVREVADRLDGALEELKF